MEISRNRSVPSEVKYRLSSLFSDQSYVHHRTIEALAQEYPDCRSGRSNTPTVIFVAEAADLPAISLGE
jgi:hypothetical protein